MTQPPHIAAQPEGEAWHSQSAEQVLAQLGSGAAGLSAQEAAQRTDPIDPDVMKRQPRRRSERITDRSFLRTMFLTGSLTAGVAFAVYVYVLKTGTVAMARTHAFAALVFAELLRSFGARSDTKPVWRISLFTNISLAIVVSVSFGLQVWSHHNAILGRFLKTSLMPLADCFLLLGAGVIPLLVLELAKMVRQDRRQGPTKQ